MRNHQRIGIALLLAATLSASAIAADKPAAPYVNQYLADSSYSVTHTASDFTALAGPTGKSRRLRADEIIWKRAGPFNGMTPVYSGPYPNGRRVVWLGGYDRVTKLDADTLEVLTTYAIGGNTFFGNEEIDRHMDALDKLDGKDMVDYTFKMWAESFPSGPSFYRMLSRDNELYLPHVTKDGTISIQVFGEADAKDPASKIQLRREFKITPDISKGLYFGVQMTSDGHVVVVMTDGVLIALPRDFSSYTLLQLPSKNGPGELRDTFSAFVRNSLATDEHGGIYVVTRENLHRVQWTGEKLSLDAADGAWSAPYPNEQGIGSGTTPALMGWGPKEDHLVVIADGNRGASLGNIHGNNMVAFWRDDIPADWKGIPGFDRRVAGITPVRFGTAKDEKPQIENALVVYGYGAFLDNFEPQHHWPDRGRPAFNIMADMFSVAIPGHETLGGTMIRWDPTARVLKTAWQNPTNFAGSICTISGANEILYCWGSRNREWALEGVDWNTGKSAFHYTLDKRSRHSPFGGPIIIAPNGAVDCGCHGGLGIVRVKPKRQY
jgi:hypothetical protein